MSPTWFLRRRRRRRGLGAGHTLMDRRRCAGFCTAGLLPVRRWGWRLESTLKWQTAAGPRSFQLNTNIGRYNYITLHTFNGPFSGPFVCTYGLGSLSNGRTTNPWYDKIPYMIWLPRWASTRKVKPVWTLLKQETMSDSGIRWAICKCAPCSRQITMPAPTHSVFLLAGYQILPPNQQLQCTEGKMIHNASLIYLFTISVF